MQHGAQRGVPDDWRYLGHRDRLGAGLSRELGGLNVPSSAPLPSAARPHVNVALADAASEVDYRAMRFHRCH